MACSSLKSKVQYLKILEYDITPFDKGFMLQKVNMQESMFIYALDYT